MTRGYGHSGSWVGGFSGVPVGDSPRDRTRPERHAEGMSLNIHAVRSAALFASAVQVSERPTARMLQDAITETVRRLGTRGCAAVVAQEFGDHPDTAVPRMCWAREQVALLATPARPVDVDRLRLAA
jgi:hypothetical protein